VTGLARVTEDGIERVERDLGIQNLYDSGNYELTHYLDNALKAQFTFQRSDRTAQRRLGDVAGGCGGGHAALVGGGHDVPELLDVH
jgi:hypothetical protein